MLCVSDFPATNVFVEKFSAKERGYNQKQWMGFLGVVPGNHQLVHRAKGHVGPLKRRLLVDESGIGTEEDVLEYLARAETMRFATRHDVDSALIDQEPPFQRPDMPLRPVN